MSHVRFKNASTYKADMGLLKTTLDTTRRNSDLLVIRVVTPSEQAVGVLMDRYKLWTLAINPGADGTHYYFFSDVVDHYAVPSGGTKHRLSIGGRHQDLRTSSILRIGLDGIKKLNCLATFNGAETIGDDSDQRQALAMLVVGLSEASRFRSILKLVSAAHSASAGSVSGSTIMDTVNNWASCSGSEGQFPDVRIHWLPGKSPAES